jgi:ankyrin repeat protein
MTQPLNERWFEAIKRNDLVVAAELLAEGVEVDAGEGLTRTTALMMAVTDRRIEMIQWLLDHGAGLAPENSLGLSAMTYALILSRTWDDLYRVANPDPRPLQMLLARGGRFGLREAVLLNDVPLARSRLNQGADVNAGRDLYEGPLLKIAAEFGHLEIVKLLVDRGADLEAIDDLGQRPLMCAARHGRSEVVAHLLDRGAEINAVDWFDQSALSRAAEHDHDQLYTLLRSRGAERTVLDAIARNDVEVLQEKLRDRSDVDDLIGDFGRVAMLAARRGNPAIVRLLLDRGAVHLLERHDDHTLLAEAARHGHVEVVQLLIERGADLHAVGKDGLTPLDWAIAGGQDTIVEILKRTGAER